MKFIKDFDKVELENLLVENGWERYRADQLWQALYLQRINSIEEISTLPKPLRVFLQNNFDISSIKSYSFQKANDGTIKFLFNLMRGSAVESVYIPYDNGLRERRTLCVSSQVGCALGCTFCATGKLGLKRNLSPAEIVDQVLFVEKVIGEPLTNIVFMGMGEPLQNFSNVVKAITILTTGKNRLFNPKNITVSTSGILPKILELAKLPNPVKLALSLHSTFDSLREKLMPVSSRWKINELRRALEEYYRKTRIPITFEYIVFEGLNDNELEARRLAKFTRSVPSKVNLIPFHPIDFMPLSSFAKELKPASIDKILQFKKWLIDAGAKAFIRSSSGIEIDGACGQLAFSQTEFSAL